MQDKDHLRAIHQSCICELERLQSHHHKTPVPLSPPVSLNTCHFNLDRKMEDSRKGFNQSQGVAISGRFSLLSLPMPGLTAATVSLDCLQHQGTASKGAGEVLEITLET